MTTEQIRQRLQSSILAAKKDGIVLVSRTYGLNKDDGRWNVFWKRCCPIGALLRGSPCGVGNDQVQDAAKMLGVTEHWVRSFVHGFDGGPLDHALSEPPDRDAVSLGRELMQIENIPPSNYRP